MGIKFMGGARRTSYQDELLAIQKDCLEFPKHMAPDGMLLRGLGGEAGIRTLDTVTRMPHFECGAFDHSATSP